MVRQRIRQERAGETGNPFHSAGKAEIRPMEPGRMEGVLHHCGLRLPARGDLQPGGIAVCGFNAKAQSRKAARRFSLLCSANPRNSSFLAEFSKRCFPMTNDKFSMTNSQFRFSTLVAACRAVTLRLCAFELDSLCRLRIGGMPAKTASIPPRPRPDPAILAACAQSKIKANQG
jgi:hypothetical protein